MKNFLRAPMRTALFLTLFLGGASAAFATVPPTLQLSATGTGDNVQITVSGDPNASVLLSYNELGTGATIVSLGNTDANGTFTETISSASYGLTSGTPVTAIVGGTGGPKSPSIAWPAVSSASTLTLSRSAVVVDVGSSASISATNNGSGSLYVSNNSNPSIANVSVNGNQITISGNVAGSTNVTLCTVGTTSSCPSVSVVVEPSGAAQLSVSNASPTVVSGQNLPITINGGNGSYVIESNSDSGTIQASLSGSVLTLSTGKSSGSSSIVVCSTDQGACGVVQASAGDASSAAISFSSSLPTMAINQSQTVSIYGPSGVSFYVSSNSNPSNVQANLSGTTLTLTGISEGTSNITVCASTGTCGSLTATITGAVSATSITVSQNALSLLVGQSATVTVSGGAQPYTLSGGTNTVASASLNGSTLTVVGVGGGSSTVWVCSAGGGCTNLAVSVNGAQSSLGSGTTSTTSTVSTGSATTVTTPAAPTEPAYTFRLYLSPGAANADVLALQKLLQSEGYLTAVPTGYYGSQTENAVLKFQAAHGIDQLGVVGPATRAALNQIESQTVSTANSSSSNTSTDISNMTLAQLETEVQTLEAELNQVLGRINQLGG